MHYLALKAFYFGNLHSWNFDQGLKISIPAVELITEADSTALNEAGCFARSFIIEQRSRSLPIILGGTFDINTAISWPLRHLL